MRKDYLFRGIFVLFLLCISLFAYAGDSSSLRERIVLECKKYVLDCVEYPSEEVVLTLKKPIAEEVSPEGKVEVRVEGDVEKDEYGKVALRVKVFSDGVLYKVFYPVLYLDLMRQAFKTKRWVKRGEAVSFDNVSEVRALRSSLPPNAVNDSAQFAGRIAKVSLPEGKIISLNNIEEPPLIKKKQIVNVVIENSNLIVGVKGQSLQEGKKGEIIKIKNFDSGKIIYGEVKDKNTVTVTVP